MTILKIILTLVLIPLVSLTFCIEISPSQNLSERVSVFSEAQAKVKKKKKKKSKRPVAGSGNELSPKRSGKVISMNFETPPSIQTAVDFWTMVYSKYDRNYEIFHDTENLGVVYSVLDFTDLYSNEALDRRARLKIFRPRLAAEEKRIMAMLERIHENQYQPDKLSKEERRIYDKFKDDPNPDKFLEAATAKRIRAQTGIKNKFLDAIRISGAYIEEFEDIFMSYGLPIELTRLAFVESMFNTKARSKVGASGVWQFMPGTGKLFGLAINKYVDERNDPIRATHAAARLLKSNYEHLGNWYLAMNAYNSGRATMSRAVAAMGTSDIGTIINNYRGGIYGFASRNFVPSFLAALEIANNYTKYFGKLPRDSKFEYEDYVTTGRVFFGQLSTTAGYNLAEMIDYNPHFSRVVISDKVKLPAGYVIRVPKGAREKFAQAEALTSQNIKAIAEERR